MKNEALDYLYRFACTGKLREPNEVYVLLQHLVEDATTWDDNKEEWEIRVKLLLWVLGLAGSGPDDVARVLWSKAHE